ncbi:MAG: (2Fe-2S) ferredoxin domain-containing protein [Synechococcaceae cyanobacterium SM2_3_2]|nr:(2Fe-2S) ferredoxin domain-containing protein [Synechococcaceae cyanobacterium SM2_3_2]
MERESMDWKHSPLTPYRWHLLLCADQTKPKCCDKATGLLAWDYLKRRIKELGLEAGIQKVHRTKANCLRGCDVGIPGPVLLVYPGGWWYREATPEVIEQILQQHLLNGIPVDSHLVAADTLDPSPILPESEPVPHHAPD